MTDASRWSVLDNGVAVFRGPYESDRVFVVDEFDPLTGWHEGAIAFTGFKTQAKAMAAFMQEFPCDGGQRYGGTTVMSLSEFNTWTRSGNTSEPLRGRKS